MRTPARRSDTEVILLLKTALVPIGIVVIVDATGDIVVSEQLSLRRAIRDDGGEEAGEVALARIGR